jgi:hypothetical protein
MVRGAGGSGFKEVVYTSPKQGGQRGQQKEAPGGKRMAM